jgi:hypothetical protein
MTVEPGEADKQLLAIFRIDSGQFSRCLAIGISCNEPAIRAHSVQNARYLDLLAEDGHVIAFGRRFDVDKGLTIDYSSVGRNRATTFEGLCTSHDNELFSAIEVGELDLESPQHTFLLAYRATIREFHATCDAVCKVQGAYAKRVELGIDPKGEPSPTGIFAVERMIVSYETYHYKLLFDEAYASRNFALLTHDILQLDVEQPTIGLSSLFSLDGVLRGDATVRVCASVLPVSPRRTVVVLSYLSEDAPLARSHLSRVLGSDGYHQRYELSKLFLNSCDNFVIAPSYFRSWTKEKRDAVREYFTRTIVRGHMEFDNVHLYLF